MKSRCSPCDRSILPRAPPPAVLGKHEGGTGLGQVESRRGQGRCCHPEGEATPFLRVSGVPGHRNPPHPGTKELVSAGAQQASPARGLKEARVLGQPPSGRWFPSCCRAGKCLQIRVSLLLAKHRTGCRRIHVAPQPAAGSRTGWAVGATEARRPPSSPPRSPGTCRHPSTRYPNHNSRERRHSVFVCPVQLKSFYTFIF